MANNGSCLCVDNCGTCHSHRPRFCVEEFDPRIKAWETLETFTTLPEAVAWFNSRKKGAVREKLGFKVKDWKMRLVAVVPIAEK